MPPFFICQETNMTVQHKDIPEAQLHEAKGASTASVGQILTATGSGTATFQTPEFTKMVMGWWDYNDTATATTPIALTAAGTEYQLTNNGLGSYTNTTYHLPGITHIWNTSTGYFDFTGLNVGDVVDTRIDIQITTASANNVVDVVIEAGIGGSSYKLKVGTFYFKGAGTYQVVFPTTLYIGDSNTKNNPARILAKNDTTGSTVRVNGWFTKVISNG